jgi:hypothetical protein
MIHPTPRYVHRARCRLEWCPEDWREPPDTKQTSKRERRWRPRRRRPLFKVQDVNEQEAQAHAGDDWQGERGDELWTAY